MPFYGQDVWDPALITAQMGAMQTIHYLTTGALLCGAASVVGTPLSLDMVFNYRLVHFSSLAGVTNVAAAAVSSLINAVALMFVVERTKKCWDFGSTLYIMHVLFCWLHMGFPASWQWWLVTVASAVSTIVIGERLCLWQESRDISVSHFLTTLAEHASSFGRQAASSSAAFVSRAAAGVSAATASANGAAASAMASVTSSEPAPSARAARRARPRNGPAAARPASAQGAPARAGGAGGGSSDDDAAASPAGPPPTSAVRGAGFIPQVFRALSSRGRRREDSDAQESPAPADAEPLPDVKPLV